MIEPVIRDDQRRAFTRLLNSMSKIRIHHPNFAARGFLADSSGQFSDKVPFQASTSAW